jgi:hypothetical protein
MQKQSSPPAKSISLLERRPLKWVWVNYCPAPDERDFLARAATKSDTGLRITVAVLSNQESARFFGARLARKGMQAVWLEVANGSSAAVRLDPVSIDPAYYTPLEASYVNHYSIGKRLLSFGLLTWYFLFLWLLLLPLLICKVLGARAANRRMDAYFKEHGFRLGPIAAGASRSGFIFTSLDEGTKTVNVKLTAGERTSELDFLLEVPGLALGAAETEEVDAEPLEEIDEQALRNWLTGQPRATTNRHGTLEGDPLNLVVAGNRSTVLQCFGARWDQAETVTLSTCWKTAKAFLFDAEYRYSPVSPLYFDGRSQDFALQMARARINERIHLRLWRTRYALAGERLWIGQISRDIGVRFTLRTWNLTTHKIDPDVDEARDYVMNYLTAARRVARFGYAAGIGAAPASTPRRNLTGDPYYTDGFRAVVILSKKSTKPSFFTWSD